MVLSLLAIFGGLRPIIVRGTSGRRRCPCCDYDLAGLDPRGTCPECGRRCTPEDLQPTPTRLRLRPSLIDAGDAALAGLVLFALAPIVELLTPMLMSLAIGADPAWAARFTSTDVHRARLATESALFVLALLSLAPSTRPAGTMLGVACFGLVGGACAYIPAAVAGLMPDPRAMTTFTILGLFTGAAVLSAGALRGRAGPGPA